MLRRIQCSLITRQLLKLEHQNLRTLVQSPRVLQQVETKSNDNNDMIVRSIFPDIEIPQVNIDEYIWHNINKWSRKVATVDAISGRQYTYGQLRDKSRILAIRLHKNFNLFVGDTIAICLPNCPEYPIVILAGLEAGMVNTTINPLYNADEISKQLVDSGAKVLFGLARMSKTLQRAVEISKRQVKIVYLKETSDEMIPAHSTYFNGLLDSYGIDYSSFKKNVRKFEDVALLPYSSGTTGKSKGVELTHRNIVSNIPMVNLMKICEETTADHQDVLPCVLPMFHAYGLVIVLLARLALGAKIVTLPKFTPDTFLNAMEKYKGTCLHLVPPIVIFLGHYDKIEKKHTDSIRYIVSGAAPMGKSDVDRLFARIPNAKFFQAYGLTETSPIVTMNYRMSENHDCVGQLAPNTEAKILDVSGETHNGLGPNQIGELCFRGPQIMKGYLHNEKATRETMTEDGFFKTGDIGYYDENFDFYVTDRMKELIKVKGFQVPPAELEEIIRHHPKVADAAVVGKPDAKSGEVPVAFVVKKPDHEVSEEEIKDYVAEKVAKYKRLDGGVVFLEAIPKNPSGKIMRRILKEQHLS